MSRPDGAMAKGPPVHQPGMGALTEPHACPAARRAIKDPRTTGTAIGTDAMLSQWSLTCLLATRHKSKVHYALRTPTILQDSLTVTSPFPPLWRAQFSPATVIHPHARTTDHRNARCGKRLTVAGNIKRPLRLTLLTAAGFVTCPLRLTHLLQRAVKDACCS